MEGPLKIVPRNVSSEAPVVHELLIVDDFYLDVRACTGDDFDDFIESVSIVRAARDGRRREVDPNLYYQRAPEFFCTGRGRGCTPLAIRKLGVRLGEDPETDERGQVSVNLSLIRQLWRHARADLFRDRITSFAQEMLGYLAQADAAKKNGLDSSSEPLD